MKTIAILIIVTLTTRLNYYLIFSTYEYSKIEVNGIEFGGRYFGIFKNFYSIDRYSKGYMNEVSRLQDSIYFAQKQKTRMDSISNAIKLKKDSIFNSNLEIDSSNVLALYQEISMGYKIGSKDYFMGKIRDPKSRLQLYNFLIRANYNVGTFKEFENSLFTNRIIELKNQLPYKKR